MESKNQFIPTEIAYFESDTNSLNKFKKELLIKIEKSRHINSYTERLIYDQNENHKFCSFINENEVDDFKYLSILSIKKLIYKYSKKNDIPINIILDIINIYIPRLKSWTLICSGTN